MNAQQFDVDDEFGTVADAMYRNPLTSGSSDHLGVLSSTRSVVELGELVWINTTSVNALQEQLLAFTRGAHSPQTWDTRYHFFDGTERTVNWVLLLDALNFCFWAEQGQPRWSIEYKGEPLNGYWAEAAALTRAVEEGYALWDARYLSEISSADLATIFRGAPSPATSAVEQAAAPAEIPLFEQRLANAREVGRVLLERFDGQFTHVIEEAAGSAVRLALLLAEHFPSFRDVASFRGQAVRFFKRAQICVADVRAHSEANNGAHLQTQISSPFSRIINYHNSCVILACWNITPRWPNISTGRNCWSRAAKRKSRYAQPPSGPANSCEKRSVLPQANWKRLPISMRNSGC